MVVACEFKGVLFEQEFVQSYVQFYFPKKMAYFCLLPISLLK